jgi:predicted transcriptional regulator
MRNTLNEQAFSEFKNNLAKCPNCERKFLPESLEVHLRSCNKQYKVQPKVEVKEIKRPKAITCYIWYRCFISGREFGTASFEIHLKSCKKKWEIQEEKKPFNERKQLPQPPKIVEEIIIGGKSGSTLNREELDQLNEQTFKSYMDNRVVCQFCGRKFASDRLEVHLRSHKKDIANPPIEEEKVEKKETKDIAMPKAIVCYIWYYS